MSDQDNAAVSGPSQEDIDRFNAAAQQYADESGLPLDDATTQLGDLLENMRKDPTSTALYFARAEMVRVVAFDLLESRVAHLEDVVGQTVVGP